MRYRRRVLMTTTSSLDGWEVTQYIGPVSAQFVVGTGLFSDFFSGITDFFGAHSRSYQKKLDRINEEALALIEEKTLGVGGNAVLGLRVDHDEISGTGKSMLMVTASGTATKINRVGHNDVRREDEGDSGALSAFRLNALMERQKVLAQAKAGTINWEDAATWQFILDNQMEELAPYVLDRVETVLDPGRYTEEGRELERQKYAEYFKGLASDVAKEYMYGAIGGSGHVWGFAFRIIQAGNLFDSERILGILESGDETARMRCIHLVVTDQPYYSLADVRAMEALEDAIRSAFSKADTHVAKGILGEKTVWKCECGHEVKASEHRCRCGRDAYGFKEKMLNPEQAVSILERKVEVLRAQLRPA